MLFVTQCTARVGDGIEYYNASKQGRRIRVLLPSRSESHPGEISRFQIIIQVRKQFVSASNSCFSLIQSHAMWYRITVMYKLTISVFRLKRLKNCMCCCVSKSQQNHTPPESHTIENHAIKGQPPLLDKVREIDKVGVNSTFKLTP